MKTDELISIFKAGVDAVNPYKLILQSLKIDCNILNIKDVSYDLSRFNNIIVIGAGKATASMAQAVENILGDRISRGVIVVKYEHTSPLKKIRQIEAGHPLPDEAGVKGTEEILRLLEGADEKTLVICLLSGGGSALLVSPSEGITLNDKIETTRLLLSAGADIEGLNTVRKHLSKVKGGRLSEIPYPATLITLMLSDVIGDRLDVIASGPTVPDNSTFKDAMDVIKKYNLVDKLPAKEKAVSMGYETEIISSELQGEARDVGRWFAKRAKGLKEARCLISGGETTVTVKGNGLGGRNQELALTFALEIEGTKGITMLSAGTDGTDGPTDAAGAIVDEETISKAKKLGLDPERYLNTNDSYNFFKKLDFLSGERFHVITGPTGTNVMDIQIIKVSIIPNL